MESLQELLDTAALKHPCDLDLLLFVGRHPDALMTSEQLAAFVGYDLPQIAKSLDLLVERRLLLRWQNPNHFARLYRFSADHGDQWVQEILKVADTLEGRRHLRQLLRPRQSPPNRATLPRPDAGSSGGSAEREDSHA